jgi:hypothetical protein
MQTYLPHSHLCPSHKVRISPPRFHGSRLISDLIEGMDLNPLFTTPTSFRPIGDGGELKLFAQAGIQLVHGWLIDPDSPESAVISKTPDYDSAVNLIADADHITMGQLVVNDSLYVSSGSSQGGPSDHAQGYTPEEREKIENGKRFLGADFTTSYLTLFFSVMQLSLSALF